MMHAHHIPSSLKSLCVGWGKVLGPVGVRYEGTVEASPAPHPASVDISLWHPLAATGASPWVKPGSFGARTCSGLGLGHVGRHVLMYTSELCPSVAPPPPCPAPVPQGPRPSLAAAQEGIGQRCLIPRRETEVQIPRETVSGVLPASPEMT